MVRLRKLIVIGLIVASVFISRTSFAQRESFDVASIKPSLPGPAGGPPRVAADGHRFTASNATFRTVLQFAYRPGDGRSLRNADIVGGPEWLDNDRFNIEAKLDDAAPPVSAEQMQRLVQNLVSDRFQFKAHWDKRDNVDVYNLVVSKDGPKIKLSDDQTIPGVGTPASTPVNPSTPPPRGQTRTIANPAGGTLLLTVSGSAAPIAPDLVNLLQGFARRPVVDKTGLNGLFDFRLQFVMEASATPAISAQTPAAAEPAGPSFFTALQEQLGLKLESAKSAIEVLVIDSVQKPSAN